MLAVSVVAVACSGGDPDGGDVAADSTAAEAPVTTEEVAGPTGSVPDAAASTTEAAADPSVTVDDSSGPAAVSTLPPDPLGVAEVGTPGLDSDDPFCSAWSRWAGSAQVILVANAFSEAGPEALAPLEIIASPVVTDAYDDMLVAWPDELEREREVAADGYFGPITRRLDVARQALLDAGADEGVLAAVSTAWLAALSVRDPSTPEFAVDLPEDVWAVVDAAASDFAARLVPFGSDPSLLSNEETPLTDAYLEVSCPDQGTLGGQEVDPDAVGS